MNPGGSRIPGTGLLVSALIACAGACSSPAVTMRPAEPLVVRYTGERPGTPQRYAGTEACRSCHETAVGFWSRTAHARSMAALAAAGRDQEASCLRCHATGYGTVSGYDRDRGPADLAVVGCEACHGPSGGHADDPLAVAPSGTLESGCPPCVINEVCRRCHTPLRSPGFTPAVSFGKVVCPKGP